MSTDREPGVVSKPPDDNVAIGESPDGDRISGDQARQLLLSKRDLLKGLGALSVLAAIAEGSIGGSGTDTLYGGIMALDKAYKVGERTYMGPDDVKDGVISSIPDSEGWLYRASDTEVDYWLDDNAWQGPMGVGSSGTKAGSSHFQSLTTEKVDVTQRFALDRSEDNPFQTRSFERSGAPHYAPHKAVSNPVLEASDVTDGTTTDFVADPFIVHDGGKFHMFFEVKESNGDKEIGHATSSDGLSWTYDQLVITGDSLAYPLTFKWNGTWHMTPATPADVDIYQADPFPTSWSVVETPFSGDTYVDPTFFRFNGRWWLIVYNSTPNPSEVELHYADVGESLTGRTWTEHPSSPIHDANSDNINGPAGRPIVQPDSIFFFYQGDSSDRVRMYHITELTTSAFTDAETLNSPVVNKSDNGEWNANDMHHIDPVMGYVGGPDIAVVDGLASDNTTWSIGIYTPTDVVPTEFRSYLNSNSTVSGDGADDTTTLIGRSFDAGLNYGGGVYTAPVTGYYRFFGRVTWAAPGSSGFVTEAKIRDFDGSTNTDLDIDRELVDQTESVTNRVDTGIVFVKTGDQIILDWNQDSGSNLDVLSGENKTFLSGYRVR